MAPRSEALWWLVMALLAAVQPLRAESKLETFVLSVGGQSTYGTFGTPEAVSTNFGGYGPIIPSNPLGLAASGIGGDYLYSTNSAAPLLANYNYSSGNWISSWSSTNQYSGSAAAAARYGEVRARANGTFAGWGDSFSIAGSEAFGIWTESMTITSPSNANGTAGSVRLTFTVEGSMSETGDAGVVGTKSFYKWGNGPEYTIVEAAVSLNFGPSFYPYSGPGRDGFTITNGLIQGQGAFESYDLPFTFGQPVDLRVGLLSYNTPAKNTAAHANFAVRLTGIRVNGGTNFVVTAGSGAVCSPDGVFLPVPASSLTNPTLTGGLFKTLVTGLDPTRRYLMSRSTNLVDGFPVIVDGPRYPTNNFTPASDYFSDPSFIGGYPVDPCFLYRVEMLP